MENMVFTLSKLGILGGTSYVPLPKNHKSLKALGNAKFKCRALWCILVLVHPEETSDSLISSCIQHFNFINRDGINFEIFGGFQNKGKTNKPFYLIAKY